MDFLYGNFAYLLPIFLLILISGGILLFNLLWVPEHLRSAERMVIAGACLIACIVALPIIYKYLNIDVIDPAANELAYEKELGSDGKPLLKLGIKVRNRLTGETAIIAWLHPENSHWVDVIVVRSGTRVKDTWFDGECRPCR